MRLLYITYIDFGESKSGSSVRPQKIYKAFLDAGHEVKLLQGQQNRRSERKKRVEEIMEWLDTEEGSMVEGCYVESPSGPIFNKADLDLLRKVHEKGIPLSYFYRDAHWLFAPELIRRGFAKKYAITFMQKRDIKVYRDNTDVFYMPSNMACNELSKSYSWKNLKPLPPGCEELEIKPYKYTRTGIYVGAATEHYGVDNLIDAYRLANYAAAKRGEEAYKLIIVTREAEYKDLFPEPPSYPWLEVFHVSGDDSLAPLYDRADVALLPLRKEKYMDLAYAIKFFEYISHGKPIICNDLVEMGGFIKSQDCGIIYDLTSEAMAEAIEKFYSEGRAEDLYQNVLKARNQNTWGKRVEEIIEDLEKVKVEKQAMSVAGNDDHRDGRK